MSDESELEFWEDVVIPARVDAVLADLNASPLLPEGCRFEYAEVTESDVD